MMLQVPFSSTQEASRADTLASLRRCIAGLERRSSARPDTACLPFETAAVDDLLPSSGLQLGALHEAAVVGLVLVRQKPGSAKGVMFITLEDETAMANLIVWPSPFEAQRRLVLSAGTMACRGRVQIEWGVPHLVAEHLHDLSDLLRSVGRRNGGEQHGQGGPERAFPLRHGRGDGATHPGAPDRGDKGYNGKSGAGVVSGP